MYWRTRHYAAMLVVGLMAPLAAPLHAQESRLTQLYGKLELDEQSDYSRIRVRAKDGIRTLFFVRDSGREVVESKVDLKRPHRLLLEYTQFMFLSYVFAREQERVLLVGLGGGSMAHFLQKHDPEAQVDIVEIDPAIVRIADERFGVRSGGNVNVITADGGQYIATTDARYNAIYLDAFLKPSDQTDANGMPLDLKTGEFYKLLQDRLAPGGVVVFNLNANPGREQDLADISRAFGQTYVFKPTVSSNVIAVATPARQRLDSRAIKNNARALDARFKATFSFEKMAGRLLRR